MENGRTYVSKLKDRNRITKGQTFGTPWLVTKIAEYRAVLETLPEPINY